MHQADIDAALILRAAEALRWKQPEISDELRAIARRLVGRIDRMQAPRRHTTDRM